MQTVKERMRISVAVAVFLWAGAAAAGIAEPIGCIAGSRNEPKLLRAAPDREMLYVAFDGELVAYSLDTLRSRARPASDFLWPGHIPGDFEIDLGVPAFTDLDWDDRGHTYVAWGTGFALLDDHFQVASRIDGIDAKMVVSARTSSGYWLIVSSDSAASLYDVTDPAAPSRASDFPGVIRRHVRNARGDIAVSRADRLEVHTPATLIGGLAPVWSGQASPPEADGDYFVMGLGLLHPDGATYVMSRTWGPEYTDVTAAGAGYVHEYSRFIFPPTRTCSRLYAMAWPRGQTILDEGCRDPHPIDSEMLFLAAGKVTWLRNVRVPDDFPGRSTWRTALVGLPLQSPMYVLLENPGSPSMSINVRLINTTSDPATAVGFQVDYPPGARNSEDPQESTTCIGAKVTAAPNGSSLALSGATLGPRETCEVSTELTLTGNGSTVMALPENAVTSAEGLPSNAAYDTSLHFLPPLVVSKKFMPDEVSVDHPTRLQISWTPACWIVCHPPNPYEPPPPPYFRVHVIDHYPSGLVNADPPNAYSSCGPAFAVAGESSVSATVWWLDRTCTLGVDVVPTSAGRWTNRIEPEDVTTANSGPPLAAEATLVARVAAPLVRASLGTTQMTAGTPFLLTLSIENRESLALTGTSVNLDYPAGIVNTAAPQAMSTCGGSVTAPPHGGSLAVSGAVVGPRETCRVSVMLMAAAGEYSLTVPDGAVQSDLAWPNSESLPVTFAAAARNVGVPLSPWMLPLLGLALAVLAVRRLAF